MRSIATSRLARARRHRWMGGLAVLIAVGCSSSGPSSEGDDDGLHDSGAGATGETPGDGGSAGAGTGGSAAGGAGGAATGGGAGSTAGGTGGTETGGTGGAAGSGGVGGGAGSAAGGAGGTGGSAGSAAGGTGGTGGTSTGGTGGFATGGTGGTNCPPCVPPPSPDCVGSGPCGCGPYTCPDAGGPTPNLCGGITCGVGESCCGPPRCGRCVDELSGVFCPDYCEYCQGRYRRMETSSFCSGPRPVLWELDTITTAFDVPECQDAFTAVPRYCCEETFEPACP